MKKYFSYIRVSTPKQGHGVSLEEQQSAIKEYAARFGLQIVGWFEEKKTAAKGGRHEFGKLLSALARGDAEGVIIHKIDRSARNLKDWANLNELIDRGIDVRFVTDGLDLQSRGGRLSADIQAIVAADFIRNLRDEVKKGIYGRLKQGIYPFKAPIGYLDQGGGKAKTIDPSLGPIVRYGFERYASGTVSLEVLCEDLGNRGLRSIRGRKLHPNRVSDFLHNPFYIGIIRVRGRTFEGVHKPLVSKAVFERVQAVLNGKAVSKTGVRDFAFRRLVRCGKCDQHLVGEFKKGRYTYYRCWRNGSHDAAIREEVLDTIVLAALELTRLTSEEISDLRDMAAEELGNVEQDRAKQRAQLQMQLARCDDRMTRLTDALLDAAIDKEAYEGRRMALLAERRGILDQIEGPLEASAQRVLSYLELPNIQQSGYENAKSTEKRTIIESITWNLMVAGKNPAITLKSPYREIVNWRLSLNCGPNRGSLGTDIRKLFGILKDTANRSIEGNSEAPEAAPADTHSAV